MKIKYATIANVLCVVLLCGIIMYLFVSWSNIPESIPKHYNGQGVIDSWTDRSELIILACIAWAIYIGISVIERFPKIWNTGVEVTPENKERVYRVLKNMLVTEKLLVVLVFVVLLFYTANALPLPSFFTPAYLLGLFGSMLFFIIRLYKVR